MSKKSFYKCLVCNSAYNMIKSVVVLVVIFSILWSCGIRCSFIVSGSMEPTIMTGALVFYNVNIPYEEIKEKDIIKIRVKNFFDDSAINEFNEFNPSDRCATHRVYKIVYNESGEKWVYTWGDNRQTPDSWVIYEENYEGKMVFKINLIAPAVNRLYGDLVDKNNNNDDIGGYRVTFLSLCFIILVDIFLAYRKTTKAAKKV